MAIELIEKDGEYEVKDSEKHLMDFGSYTETEIIDTIKGVIAEAKEKIIIKRHGFIPGMHFKHPDMVEDLKYVVRSLKDAGVEPREPLEQALMESGFTPDKVNHYIYWDLRGAM